MKTKFIYILLIFLLLSNLTLGYLFYKNSSQNSFNKDLIDTLKQNQTYNLNLISELKQNNSYLESKNINLSSNLSKSLHRESNNKELFEIYKNKYSSCDRSYQELYKQTQSNNIEFIYLESSCNYQNYVSLSSYNTLIDKKNELYDTCQLIIDDYKTKLDEQSLQNTIIQSGFQIMACSQLGLCY